MFHGRQSAVTSHNPHTGGVNLVDRLPTHSKSDGGAWWTLISTAGEILPASAHWKSHYYVRVEFDSQSRRNEGKEFNNDGRSESASAILTSWGLIAKWKNYWSLHARLPQTALCLPRLDYCNVRDARCCYIDLVQSTSHIASEQVLG